MNIIDFLKKHYEVIRDSQSLSISSICTHSNAVKKSALFIALKGKRSDGHDFLKLAVQKGAHALLVEKTDKIPKDFKGTILKYDKELKNLPNILNQFYDFPSRKLFTVGVTGTNGKTSFCYMLEHILKSCGWPTAVIGTVDQHFEKQYWSSYLTTPDSSELFERMNDFVRLEARALVMEVSSIGLDQKRLEGVDFKAMVFTNLSQDHLDYHKNMENYFQAKKKLFLQNSSFQSKNVFCLINQDDKYGRILKKSIRKPCYSYGQDSHSDFCFKIKKCSGLNSVFEIKSPAGVQEFFLPLLPGDHNIYNAVSAVSCALLIGFKAKACANALKSFPGVPGRLEKITAPHIPFEILIDYAHTPSALSCTLNSLKPRSKKIILVFGCGGDRDKDKRPQMVSTALKTADKIFFTTDNPRYEDPQQIFQSALKEISKEEKEKITLEKNREKAIKTAIQSARPGDCILIAGKGHEQFQIIKDKKFPFSDKQKALDCLEELGLS